MLTATAIGGDVRFLCAVGHGHTSVYAFPRATRAGVARIDIPVHMVEGARRVLVGNAGTSKFLLWIASSASIKAAKMARLGGVTGVNRRNWVKDG